MDLPPRDETGRSEGAASFGQAAEAYARARPSYPATAVDWVVQDARRVLDLGAGTGALTRALVERGLDVVAVEPSEEMRAQLVTALPHVDARPGTAEHTGLPDAAVDAVVVAQAWHWEHPGLALPEVARVLRPGGSLAVLWNMRDERVAWVAQLGDLLAEAGRKRPDNAASHRSLHGHPLFGTLESFETSWHQPLDLERVVDLVASRSFVILMALGSREALLAEVRRLAARHADEDGTLTMPYVTRCWRTRRE